MDNVVYTNGFRIAMSGLETQISFSCNSPIVDENSGEIVGVDSKVVADIRMNPVLAKDLLNALKEQFDRLESVNNANE